jgi:hypothetical protein
MEEAAAPAAGDEVASPSQDLAATAGSLQVDADLASDTAALDLTAKKSPTGPKPLSLLGAKLSDKVASPLSSGKKSSSTAPETSPGMDKMIVNKYAHEVREADRLRKTNYLSIQQLQEVAPCGIEVARGLQSELQTMTQSIGGAHNVAKGMGWNAVLANDDFQKRLKYLHDHSRTGHFVEQYGPDGMYEGDFMHGMRHGKGRYEFREEVYDGEWKWDHRHGWGQLSCADGSTIKGEWQNGKTHGFASVVDQKGTVIYEGEFKEGKRHGLGRQLFESGDMYDGGWQNGRLNDRGVYYFTNGDRLLGMWKEGLYDGVGVFHYADGSISRREYKDGILMTVQDYEQSTHKYGKTLTRDGMQKHTRDRDFPKEVFLLNHA